MEGNGVNHNNLILSQFFKQTIPFSNIPGHSGKAVYDPIIKTSGIGKNDAVLDVACRPGILTIALAIKADHVIGIGKVPDMIKRAKQRQKEKNIENISWEIGVEKY